MPLPAIAKVAPTTEKKDVPKPTANQTPTTGTATPATGSATANANAGADADAGASTQAAPVQNPDAPVSGAADYQVPDLPEDLEWRESQKFEYEDKDNY